MKQDVELARFNKNRKQEPYMTEEDVRKIVKEEIEKARANG
jgi:hypothetical protein